MITQKLLTTVCPTTRPEVLSKFIKPLNDVTKHYNINTPKRVAAFLAQLASENLNYSAQGLLKIFPKYFKSQEEANNYAKKPQKIANKVYANRMGNTEPNDGYTFRGRGLIQLTGKYNYQRFSKPIEESLENTIKFLETPLGQVLSAGWFWDANKLNIYADKDDFIGLTRRINGGTIGLKHRAELYNKAIKGLSK
jgi:putative chitinase